MKRNIEPDEEEIEMVRIAREEKRMEEENMKKGARKEKRTEEEKRVAEAKRAIKEGI